MTSFPKIEILDINIKHRYMFLVGLSMFATFVFLIVLFAFIDHQLVQDFGFFLILPIVYLTTRKVAHYIMRKINYKNCGPPQISSKGILNISPDRTIDLKHAQEIVFRYCGDEQWDSHNSLLSKFLKWQRYNRWVMTNKKEIFDHLEVDKELVYFKILEQNDKAEFLKFVNLVKEINHKTILIHKGRIVETI